VAAVAGPRNRVRQQQLRSTLARLQVYSATHDSSLSSFRASSSTARSCLRSAGSYCDSAGRSISCRGHRNSCAGQGRAAIRLVRPVAGSHNGGDACRPSFKEFNQRLRSIGERERVEELPPPQEIAVDFRERCRVAYFFPEPLDRLDLPRDELGRLIESEKEERRGLKAGSCVARR
jgi:hypothetical protein